MSSLQSFGGRLVRVVGAGRTPELASFDYNRQAKILGIPVTEEFPISNNVLEDLKICDLCDYASEVEVNFDLERGVPRGEKGEFKTILFEMIQATAKTGQTLTLEANMENILVLSSWMVSRKPIVHTINFKGLVVVRPVNLDIEYTRLMLAAVETVCEELGSMDEWNKMAHSRARQQALAESKGGGR